MGCVRPLGQELALVDGVPGEREVVGVGAFTTGNTVVEVRLPELTPLSKDGRVVCQKASHHSNPHHLS